MEKVLETIAAGRREGARLLTGGRRLTDGELGKGFFVAPTVFDNTATTCRSRGRRSSAPSVAIALRRRGRGDPPRQCDELRPCRGRIHARSDAGASRDRAARSGRVLDQPLQRHADRTAVRRLQVLRVGPRERQGGDRTLHASSRASTSTSATSSRLIESRPMSAGGDEEFDYVIVGAGSAGCVLADSADRGRPKFRAAASSSAGRTVRSSSRCRRRCRSR